MVQQALQLSGASARSVDNFCNCGAHARVIMYTDELGGYGIRCQRCKHRYCEPCGRARALKIADAIRAKIDQETYLNVNLTLAHRKRGQQGTVAWIRAEKDRLYRCFKLLRQTPLWKNATDGGVACYQVHPTDDGCYHHHFHILTRGKWIRHADLSAAWLRITGDSTVVYIKEAGQGESVVRDVVRYVSRPAISEKVTDPHQLAEIMEALKGSRLFFGYGRWHGTKWTAAVEITDRPYMHVDMLVNVKAHADAGDKASLLILELIFGKITPARPPPTEQPYLWCSEHRFY